MALTASSSIICKRRFFFHPKQHKTAASAAQGDSGRPSRPIAAADEEAVNFKVVEAAAPDGVTVDGEKLHDTPEGNPDVQLNETAELNPFIGVTEIVVVVLFPAVTVNVAGEAATE